MKKLTYLAAMLAAPVAFAAPAQAATTITFTGLPNTGVSSNTFTEAGFDLIFDGFFIDAGQDEVEPLCCNSGGTLTIRRTDGGLFSFGSVDLQREYGTGQSSLFAAGQFGGSTIFNDVFGIETDVYETQFSLSPSTLIDSLVFSGQRDNDNGVSFTNVVLDAAAAVPEPATWAFMIFGFGAIGGTLRSNRRRQRKANVKVSYA